MKDCVRYFILVMACLAAGLPAGIWAADAAAVPAAVTPDFYRDVFPFLKKNCVSCHNKTTTKAGLNMETPALMKTGGDTGPSIIPGKSGESLLVEACLHLYDLEMPPMNNKSGAVDLTTAEVAILKTWIDQGAKDSVQEERKITWQAPAVGVQPIYTLAMTRDGRFAACGRANEIFLYDLATRQFVGQIADAAEKPPGAHRALVQALHFSPDGSRLASGSYREVKIWKKQQGSASARKADPALGLVISAMSRDGSKIVGVDKAGALLLLNAADGKVIKKIPGVDPKGAGIQLLSLAPDASKAAVFSTAEGWKLSVWNLNDGKVLATQTSPDPAVEKLSREAQGKLAAAVKAEAVAKAAIQPAQAARLAATKVVADLKAQVAKVPKDKPNPELQKKHAAAELELAKVTKAESSALAAGKNTQTAKVAADKAAKDSAAKLAAVRKVAVRSLAWTSDGKFLATAGDDKLLSIWTLPPAGSAANFAASKKLTGAAGAITVLAAGPTADQIVSAGADNKVRVWSLSQAKVLREIAASGVTSLDVSPDGKFLASGDTGSAIRIWDLATGKQSIELYGSVATQQQIAELDWTVNLQTLEEAFQKSVITKIEAQNKALDVLLQKAKDAIVAMNKKLPTSEKAIKPAQEAVAAAQKTVDDAEAVIAKAPEAKADAAMDKALKAAQDKLITAKIAERSAQAAFNAVKSNITDAQAQEKRIAARKTKNATDLAAAKAATEAATKVRTKASTDLAAARKALTKAAAKPLAVSFSTDGQKVAATFDDGALKVWAVATGTPLEQVKGSTSTAASLNRRANGSFVSCSHDTGLVTTSAPPRWVLERVLGGEKNPKQFADRINAVRFSPDGKWLATGGGEASRSGDVILFNVASGKVSASWMEKHDDSVVSLDFSPDGKLLASGATDMIARVTDVATGKQTNLFEGHTHHVTGIAFRADGRVLATAGADGVVNSWDMIIGERQKKIEGWTKEVTSLQFIGATNKIVTSAGDNLVRIVNDAGSQVRSISKLPDFMQAAASSADGSTIIGGGEDSFLRVWNGADGKEITAFGPR